MFGTILRVGRRGDQMKILFWTAIVLIAFTSSYAQQTGSISGKTTMDGKPVSVPVSVSSKTNKAISLRTQSDQLGQYTFAGLAAGEYEIVAPNAAVPVQRKVDLRAGENLEVDLNLSVYPSAISERVTVSAGQSQSIEGVSKTVNVIDGQEMRDRADFSLIDSLRTIPGFRVQQLGGFGRTANIKTRGLRNQDTAILIDGVRFRDVSSITGDASAFLSDLTLTSVSRVEVLRGSGSSLYGTNAIGGTIDFQTPKPTAGPHGQIGGAFGELGLGRFRGNLSDGTQDGKFGFNLGISRTVYTKGIDGQDNAHNTNFQSRIDYDPFSRTNISGRIFVSDAYVRLNSDPDTFGSIPFSNAATITAEPGVNFVFDANDPDNFQRSKFFDAQISFVQVLNDHTTFQGYYSGLKTSRKNDNGILGVGFQAPSTSVFDGTIQTVHGHVNWVANSISTLTAGYEFEYEKYGNDGFTPDGSANFFTRAYQSSHTFYAQELLSLLKDRLQLAGGVRAQFFGLRDPRFSSANAPYSNVTLKDPPTAYTFDGAVSYYLPKTGTKLRVHVGNGYRVPSLFERFGTFFNSFDIPPDFVALGDPNLKPEKTIAADGGIEQELFKNRAKLTAVYFYTKLTDIIGFGNIVPDIGPTPRPFGGYENQKGGIARGVEFSGRVTPTRTTDIFASYTFTNSDQRTPQVTGNPDLETLGIPKHQFTLVATQRVQRFWVNFDLVVSSSYLAPIFSNSFFQTYVYRFAGNRRGDLTAGYTFPIRKDKMDLRLYGTVENVFDYDYFENGFRTPGRNSRIGLSFGF